MKFARGVFRTKGGLKAVTTGLKSIDQHWVIQGAIECPETLALSLHEWNHEGLSAGHEIDPNFTTDCDLTEEPWIPPVDGT